MPWSLLTFFTALCNYTRAFSRLVHTLEIAWSGTKERFRINENREYIPWWGLLLLSIPRYFANKWDRKMMKQSSSSLSICLFLSQKTLRFTVFNKDRSDKKMILLYINAGHFILIWKLENWMPHQCIENKAHFCIVAWAITLWNKPWTCMIICGITIFSICERLFLYVFKRLCSRFLLISILSRIFTDW